MKKKKSAQLRLEIGLLPMHCSVVVDRMKKKKKENICSENYELLTQRLEQIF